MSTLPEAVPEMTTTRISLNGCSYPFSRTQMRVAAMRVDSLGGRQLFLRAAAERSARLASFIVVLEVWLAVRYCPLPGRTLPLS